MRYSQAGQDKWVMSLFSGGFYIDVGAYDGIESSNTLLLEEQGWSGLCIEAGPQFASMCSSNRPKSTTVAKAVKNYAGTTSFSNFSTGTVGESIPCDTLTNILDAYGAPKVIEYMSLDIEGGEEEAIQSLDWDKYQINSITVEHNKYAQGEEQKVRLFNLLSERGFVRVEEDVPCLDPSYYMQPYEDWYVNRKWLQQQVTTYITIHSAELVKECHDSGVFSSLSNVVYLCVGNKDFSSIPSNIPHIICKSYDPNWEQYPSFYDFTGWECLHHHDLVRTPYLLTLQYDHEVLNNLLEYSSLRTISSDCGVLSYVPADYGPWIMGLAGFHVGLNRAMKACGYKGGAETIPDGGLWPTTQGMFWRTSYFHDFMEWFKPAFGVLEHEVFAGHIAERLLNVHTKITSPAEYLPNSILHKSLDVHGTKDLILGNIGSYQAKASTFGKG